MFTISNIKFFDYLYRKLRSVLYLFITILIFPYQAFFLSKAKIKLKKDYSRVDILKILIDKKDSDMNYLEIGCDLNQTFSKINLVNKYGVDPIRGGNIRKTSSEFFKDNITSFDIVFIDGSHLVEDVHEDFINSFNSLNVGGFILLDDVLPKYEINTTRRRFTSVSNQDAYKIIFFLNQIKHIEFYYLPYDHGLGLVKKISNENLKIFNFNYGVYNFKQFIKNLEKEKFLDINELKSHKNLYNLLMNFFQLIFAYIKKNLKTAQETEDSDERKKQWIKIVFGIVLALGYGGLHVPPNVSLSEVIYALGILFITLYVVFRALKYFKLI